MNYFETITKFLPEVVDQYFVEDSKTKILENGSKYIDVSFEEAGYVKIADVLLDGMSNYYRTQEQLSTSDLAGYSASAYDYNSHAAYAGNVQDGMRDGFAIGGTTIRWEIFKLQWCRGRQFRIDQISNEETAKVVTGHLVEEFHRLKVIPEVDACRFGIIADSASISLGNLVEETTNASSAVSEKITSANILSKFFAMRTWLVEHEVALEDLVWFVRPDVYAILVNSSDLTKYITQSDYKSEEGITIQVLKFNGVPIIEVPSSRFFTSVLVTDNGFQATSSSRSINYMMCSKKCIVPIRKIEYQKMYNEDMAGIAGFYGTMFNYLLYHGVVIPRNKLVGTFVSVDAADTAVGVRTNTLSVDLRPGSTSGYTKLNAYFTAPSGMRGVIVMRTAAQVEGNATASPAVPADPFVVGETLTLANETIVELNGQFQASANAGFYFALADHKGVVLAISKKVTVVAALIK